MAASKPTFHMYVISLYHLCRYVFVLMLTEHAQARPQFSISYLPLLKLCADPLHRRDIDLTVIFKSGRILSSSFRCAIVNLSIPIPFIMPNRLTGAPYLALLSTAVVPFMLISFILRTFPTFSIIPYLISFVKRYFNYFFNKLIAQAAPHTNANIKTAILANKQTQSFKFIH